MPLTWGPDKNLLWKTALPGWGNSTPVIWQDAVFVTTQEEDRLLLLRLDRRTGQPLCKLRPGSLALRSTPSRQAGMPSRAP